MEKIIKQNTDDWLILLILYKDVNMEKKSHYFHGIKVIFKFPIKTTNKFIRNKLTIFH